MLYRGLTWDHPRGYRALRHLATRLGGNDRLDWDAQPLEGFESAPIDELAARYDLIVLDHPHLGDALATGCLRPIEDLLGTEWPGRHAADFVGPSLASYRLEGRLWALPLDAATQVCAYDPDRVQRPPQTWDEVEELARRVPVALCLAGPHALMTLYSLCVALGAEPGPDGRLDDRATDEALGRMAAMAAHGSDRYRRLNPISLLELLSARQDLACIPLIYQYVGYARRPAAARVRFADAPGWSAGGRPGSVIGGTGLAVSRRCDPSPALIEHLQALVGAEWQAGPIVDEDGQPARVDAWADPRANATSDDFYRRTRATIDAAWIRPRFPGYPRFQATASAVVREAVLGDRPLAEVPAVLEGLRRQAVGAAG